MNIEINEKQLYKLINRIIINHYGHDLVMKETDGGYLKFIIPGIVDRDGNEEMLFHKNYWGMLWVNDVELVEKIKSMFGFDENEIKEFLSKYFEYKYNIVVKQVSIPN